MTPRKNESKSLITEALELLEITIVGLFQLSGMFWLIFLLGTPKLAFIWLALEAACAIVTIAFLAWRTNKRRKKDERGGKRNETSDWDAYL